MLHNLSLLLWLWKRIWYTHWWVSSEHMSTFKSQLVHLLSTSSWQFVKLFCQFDDIAKWKWDACDIMYTFVCICENVNILQNAFSLNPCEHVAIWGRIVTFKTYQVSSSLSVFYDGLIGVGLRFFLPGMIINYDFIINNVSNF